MSDDPVMEAILSRSRDVAVEHGSPGSELLADYCLARGDRVEVELLVVSDTGRPRLVEGPVAGATAAMLLIGGRASDTRVPWHAIAAIRNAPAAHPAN